MNPPEAPNRRMEARPPEAESTHMRRYTLFSAGVHALAFSLISFPLVRPPRPMPVEPIYNVALVQWPEPNYNPPVPARKPIPTPPKPKPKPEPVPPEKAVVVPEKEKPKPKPTETPKPKESPPPAETKATPEETVDQPVSLGTVDQKDFKHDYYLELLRGILARAWNPPNQGEGLMKTSLHFVILRDGTIVNPEITSASGWSLYDRSAMGAVLSVKRLPPLPEAYAGEQLGLTVNFQRMLGEPAK